MITIKKLLGALALISTFILGNAAYAADIGMNADANDVAVHGYDTVSYFVDNKPMQGSSEFTATHNNAIYQFVSAEHRDAFRANPEKYAPQYGGYCAFGVSVERKFDGDPLAWKVVDGKLYLNLNKDVQKAWFKDIPGKIAAANGIWPEIKSVSDTVLAAR